jgi:hypothetical protein
LYAPLTARTGAKTASGVGLGGNALILCKRHTHPTDHHQQQNMFQNTIHILSPIFLHNESSLYQNQKSFVSTEFPIADYINLFNNNRDDFMRIQA